MSVSLMKQREMDTRLREGYEYVDAFWEILLKFRRMRTLELEFEYGVACEHKNEFYRKVEDNDKPGRRHMLPFVWSSEIGSDGVRRGFQVPVRFESTKFDIAMRTHNDKVATARAAWNRAKLAEGKEV